MSTTFFRGVVTDVLNSTSGQAIRNDSLERYRSIINVPELKAFPRNTAIVKQISKGSSKIMNREIICYPMFSSHLCMPLKPGEYVWFVYEDPNETSQVAYWISRITEPNHVDDVNYTFAARTYVQSPNKTKKGAADRFDGVTAESEEVQTYSYRSPTADPKELANIIEDVAKKVHRFEPVPRYVKRPGDLVLQGSNNSLIMLGEERGQSSENPLYVVKNSSTTRDGSESSAIDIVVGRGNFASTSGKSIKNEFGIDEIDKREQNPLEGDVHFPTDAARIYLTSNSDVRSSNNPDSLLSLRIPADNSIKNPILNGGGSFVVAKADNLRLVARESGSIRIVKEAGTGENVLSSAGIVLHDDGTIQITGNSIRFSGNHTGTGSSQAYVRHDPLSKFLASIMQDIITFCETLKTHTTPGYGAPSLQIVAASDLLKASIESKKRDLEGKKLDINSTVVFGE